MIKAVRHGDQFRIFFYFPYRFYLHMTSRSGIYRKGALLILLLAAAILIAGCTTPSGSATGTPTPAVPAAATHAPAATTTMQPTEHPNTTEIAAIAASFAGRIDGNALKAATLEGPNSTPYATVLSQLKGIQANDSRLAYVYTVQQQNGTVRFVVDAAYGTPEGSDFLEPYPDAAKELLVPVTAPISAGPYTDPWGTFVSGYAPVYTTTGEVAGILGVDIRV
jgi:hypothetical protein